jgi:hypothetical protein
VETRITFSQKDCSELLKDIDARAALIDAASVTVAQTPSALGRKAFPFSQTAGS